MTERKDLEADVSGGRQTWEEPTVKALAHTVSSAGVRSAGLREVYAPIRGPHAGLDRAIREVTEAEIRGAFIGRDEALANGG